MSGMVFSLIVAGLTLGLIRPVLLNEFAFQEYSDGSWRGTVREGTHSIQVQIRRRGEEIVLILPDRSIPPEVCDAVVKRLAARLYALVLNKEIPQDSVDILGPSNSFCNYCLEPVYMPFRCGRCGGFFCTTHRLPERHDCPGDEKTESAAHAEVPLKEEDAGEEKRIVVRVVACG